MELTFKQEKQTKNTVRYQEQSNGDVVIGPLYVQKSALGKNPPAELSITIDNLEGEPDEDNPDSDGFPAHGTPGVEPPAEEAPAEEPEEVEETA